MYLYGCHLNCFTLFKNNLGPYFMKLNMFPDQYKGGDFTGTSSERCLLDVILWKNQHPVWQVRRYRIERRHTRWRLGSTQASTNDNDVISVATCWISNRVSNRELLFSSSLHYRCYVEWHEDLCNSWYSCTATGRCSSSALGVAVRRKRQGQ